MVVMPDADSTRPSTRSWARPTARPANAAWRSRSPLPVGDKTATRSWSNARARRSRALKVGPGTDPDAEMGPLVTEAAPATRFAATSTPGVEEGAKLVVDGRGFKMQGYEDGFFLGGTLFDHVTPDMTIYKEEIFGPVLAVVRAPDYDAAVETGQRRTSSATAPRSSRATAMRRASSHTRSRSAWSASTCRSRCRWRSIQLRRLESVAVRRPSHARPRGRALLHEAQDHHEPLADRHPLRRGFRDADDAVIVR